MAEEPKESSKFDVSDLEKTSAETPKAKRKRAEAKVEPLPRAAKPRSILLPGVHERPKKGGRKSDVDEALDMVREAAVESARDAKMKADKEAEEEREWNAKIEEAKAKIAEDEKNAVPAKSEVEESLAELRGIEEDRAWEEKIAEAKSGIEKEETAKREAEAAEAKKRRIAEMGERVDRAMEDEDKTAYTEAEDAWFKKGEDDEARQMAEARATIERGGKGELMVAGESDIAANIKEAQAMLERKDLDPREFSVADYKYLLDEEKRLDQELETAGWWKARGLRKQLAQIRKGGYEGASGSQGLDDYEKQMMSAKTGSGAAKLAAKGAAVPDKKPSFWERLRMSKGR